MHAAPFQLRQEEGAVHQPRGERRGERDGGHDGDADLPVAGHFEDDQRGRDRRAQHGGGDGPHPRQRIDRGGTRDIGEDGGRDHAEGQPRQRPHHQRGRKDSAPHAPAHGDRHGDDLEDAEHHRLPQQQVAGECGGGRLIADADDMGKPDRHAAQHCPRHSRAQPARQAGDGLDAVAHVLGHENGAHQDGRHQPAEEAEDQEGRQLTVEFQRVDPRQHEFGDAAIFEPVDHRARHGGDGDGGEGMDGEMAQHHLEREKRAGDGGVEAGRDSGRHGAAQKVAPGDSVGADALADPARDDGGHMDDRPLAPAGTAGGQRDERGRGRCEAGAMLDPAVLQRRALDHIGDRADAAIGREAVQDQPHHQPACDGQGQHPIPGHRQGKAVQHRHVIGAVEHGLQHLDPLAEQKGRETGGDADDQGDQPELELAGAALFQQAPDLGQGLPCAAPVPRDLRPDHLGHQGRAPLWRMGLVPDDTPLALWPMILPLPRPVGLA